MPLIGITMLATRLALQALLRSCSFSLVNSAMASSSWQKVFTTFWPVSISSTKPFIWPRLCCCWRKWLAEMLPSLRVVTIMMTDMMTVSKVSGHESTIMEVKVMTIVMSEEQMFGSDEII